MMAAQGSWLWIAEPAHQAVQKRSHSDVRDFRPTSWRWKLFYTVQAVIFKIKSFRSFLFFYRETTASAVTWELIPAFQRRRADLDYDKVWNCELHRSSRSSRLGANFLLLFENDVVAVCISWRSLQSSGQKLKLKKKKIRSIVFSHCFLIARHYQAHSTFATVSCEENINFRAVVLLMKGLIENSFLFYVKIQGIYRAVLL